MKIGISKESFTDLLRQSIESCCPVDFEPYKLFHWLLTSELLVPLSQKYELGKLQQAVADKYLKSDDVKSEDTETDANKDNYSSQEIYVEPNSEAGLIIAGAHQIARIFSRKLVCIADVVYSMIVASIDERDSFVACWIEAGFDADDIVNFVNALYTMEGFESNQIESVVEEQNTNSKVPFCTMLEKGATLQNFSTVCRDDIVDSAILAMCRKDKNNVIFTGNTGIGKSCIVNEVLSVLGSERCPESLRGRTIFFLDSMKILFNVSTPDQIYKHVHAVFMSLHHYENTILVIDKLDRLISSDTRNAVAMYSSIILESELSKSSTIVIGTMNSLDSDCKLSILSKFTIIPVTEPTKKECVEMISSSIGQYEQYHNVKFSEEAIATAIDAAVADDSRISLPGRAIGVLDYTGAALNKCSTTKTVKFISDDTIRCIIPDLLSKNKSLTKLSQMTKLHDLDTALQNRIFGQNEAIQQCIDAIKIASLGLNADNKPIASFLFVGQTGTGKTELARQLAKALDVEFLKFDMSEYNDEISVNKLIGVGAGYVGYDNGGTLVNKVRKHPNAVVLFDEIEKANPKIYNLLLQIMDDAVLTDNHGTQASFKDTIIIMTSNAGASTIVRNGLGFGKDSKIVDDTAMDKAIEATFSPEFRNRLTAVIKFNGISDDMANKIVHRELSELASRLSAKGVNIFFEKPIYDKVIHDGFSKEFGARELLRTIDREVKLPIANYLIDGSLQQGSQWGLTIQNDKNKLFEVGVN